MNGMSFRFAIVIAVLLPAAVRPALAQTDTTTVQRVQLEADSLVGLTVDGEQVRRLVGSVRLRQGTTRLRAREATQYVAREEILFTGEVRIVDQGDSLWADRVWYDTRLKIGEALGEVHLSDGLVDVYSPSAEYFVDEKRAEFQDGLRLLDSLTVLTSLNGIYWSERAEALFYDSVRVQDPDAVIRADTVYYQRDTGISRARGEVTIVRTDTLDNTRTIAFARRAYYDPDTDYSRLEGRPLVMQIRRDTAYSGPAAPDVAQSDTLLVRAARPEWTRRDSVRRLTAVDSVRLWRADLAAVADSAVFERSIDSAGNVLAQELRLFLEPLAWTSSGASNTQISGDTLRFFRQPGAPDSLFALSGAFVARQDSAIQRIQQLQGERVLVLLRNDSLRSLQAGPQAEAIYYLAEDGRPSGAVRVSGDRIFFVFEQNEVERVRVLSGIEGKRFPEDGLPEPFKLSRYVWKPELRPEKAELMAGR